MDIPNPFKFAKFIFHAFDNREEKITSIVRIPQFEKAFGKVINPFCTHGYIDKPKSDDWIIKINGERCGSFWGGLDMERVKKHATPAPFGLNQETDCF